MSLNERGVYDCDGGDEMRKLWRGVKEEIIIKERSRTSEPMMAVYGKERR